MSNENKTLDEFLAEKQQAGYLFRGEPQEYEDVTSSLYRSSTHPVRRDYIDRIEHDRIEACLHHCNLELTVENALRKNSEMQHYSGPTNFGPTNLIDFTRCRHIALYFACDKDLECDGRIVMIHQDQIPDGNAVGQSDEDGLFPWGGHTYVRRELRDPPDRAESQKSVFIHCKNGILDKRDINYETISIPSDRKIDISSWLAREKGIDTRFIYPDTLGFLQSSVRPHHSIEYMRLAEQQLLKTRVYRYVIETCRRSTNEVPHPYVYHIWGIAHLQLGEKQEAIDKFDRALKIDGYRDLDSGNKDLTNGALVATLTAKNIAEGIRGEYPTPYAIFSLNHRLGKGLPLPRESGMFTMPHLLYTPAPDTIEYQCRRWYVLNLFYDYNELWDALPQLDEGEQYAFALAEEYAKYREQHGQLNEDQDFVFFIERTRFLSQEQRYNLNVDRNFEFYLHCCMLDRAFYRKFRRDELHNPLK